LVFERERVGVLHWFRHYRSSILRSFEALNPASVLLPMQNDRDRSEAEINQLIARPRILAQIAFDKVDFVPLEKGFGQMTSEASDVGVER
jgi:hypothetical protein